MKIAEAVKAIAKATVSTHHGYQANRNHNRRDPDTVAKEPHIDPNGVHETWHDESHQMAYRRIFGASVERYDAKQRRKDRKYGQDGYYKAIYKESTGTAKNRRRPVHELIVGVYCDSLPDDFCKTILREYYDDFQRRNPNMIVIGAYYHADEQGKNPHLHLDYVPVGHGYVKGIDTQVSMEQACREQGIETDREKEGERWPKGVKKKTALVKWEAQENDEFDRICTRHGLQVDHPRAGKSHMSVELYKLQKEIERLQEMRHEMSEATYERLQGLIKEVERIQGIKENRWHKREYDMEWA